MRLSVALVVPVLSLSACVSVSQSLQRPVNLKVIEAHDRFRDAHRWTTQFYFVDGGPLSRAGLPEITVAATAVENGAAHPEAPNDRFVALLLRSESEGWRFLGGAPDVDLIVDGAERMHLGKAMVGGQVTVRVLVGVEEDMVVPLTFDQLQHIANAQQVEMQLGSAEFALRPATIDVLRELVSELQAAGFAPNGAEG